MFMIFAFLTLLSINGYVESTIQKDSIRKSRCKQNESALYIRRRYWWNENLKKLPSDVFKKKLAEQLTPLKVKAYKKQIQTSTYASRQLCNDIHEFEQNLICSDIQRPVQHYWAEYEVLQSRFDNLQKGSAPLSARGAHLVQQALVGVQHALQRILPEEE